jgi:hypothetical protein
MILFKVYRKKQIKRIFNFAAVLSFVLIIGFSVNMVSAAGFTQGMIKQHYKYLQQKEKNLKQEYQKYEKAYDRKKQETIKGYEEALKKLNYGRSRTKDEAKKEELTKKINYYQELVKKEQANSDFKLWDEWRNEKTLQEIKARKEYRKKVGFWKYYGSKLFGKWVLYTEAPEGLEGDFWEETGNPDTYDDYRRRTMTGIEKLFWEIGFAAEQVQGSPVVPGGSGVGVGF